MSRKNKDTHKPPSKPSVIRNNNEHRRGIPPTGIKTPTPKPAKPKK